MSDVVVRLGLDQPSDEVILNKAIETYTCWRHFMCDDRHRIATNDAPDIMVKTGWSGDGAVLKTLIFQERRWAAAFLRIWRTERRQAR
jgi:hypothetical protein